MKKIRILALLYIIVSLSNTIRAQEEAYIERFEGIPSNASVFQINVLEDNTKIIATDLGIYSINFSGNNANQISPGSFNTIVGKKQSDLWAGMLNGSIMHIPSGK